MEKLGGTFHTTFLAVVFALAMITLTHSVAGESNENVPKVHVIATHKVATAVDKDVVVVIRYVVLTAM